jgi:hypothetical protein
VAAAFQDRAAQKRNRGNYSTVPRYTYMTQYDFAANLCLGEPYSAGVGSLRMVSGAGWINDFWSLGTT